MSLYRGFLEALATKRVDLSSDDFLVLLLHGYVPDFESHGKLDDISRFEVSGDGYESGGRKLRTFWIDGRLTLYPVLWPEATIKASSAVLYNSTTDVLVSCWTFEELSSYKGPFKLTWDNDLLLQWKNHS